MLELLIQEVMQWWWPVLVVGCAYLILGIAGFGSALVSVPLLAWIWPLPEVVGLVLLMDIPTSILHGGLNVKSVRLGMLKRTLPGMVAGCALGLWLIGALEPRWPLALLGAYVFVVGLQWLRGHAPSSQPLSALRFHVLCGFIGVIEIMFGTAGPVVLALLRRLLHDVQTIRATAPVVMVVASILALLSLWASNAFDMGVVANRWMHTFPMAALAVVVGNHFARRIPTPWMVRLVAVLLMLCGLSLMRWLWQ